MSTEPAEASLREMRASDRAAQFLLGDFSEHILRFYKARSETAAAAA
jgi:hypothetical protein